jgi:outer membrane receptor protein involved in Fe transport
LGLVFKPIETVSLYASYSRSYLPQSGDQFTSLDLTSQALEPEKFDNYEIGAKWELRPAWCSPPPLISSTGPTAAPTWPAASLR